MLRPFLALVVLAGPVLVACSSSEGTFMGCQTGTSVTIESKTTPTWPDGSYAITFEAADGTTSCTSTAPDYVSNCSVAAAGFGIVPVCTTTRTKDAVSNKCDPSVPSSFLRFDLAGQHSGHYSVTLSRDGAPILTSQGDLRYGCEGEGCCPRADLQLAL